MLFFRRFALLGIASAALVLVACVGDTPVNQVPDAGVDSSLPVDAAADSSPVDSSADTSVSDASSDAADASACLNAAPIGNTVSLPTNGFTQFRPVSGPMASGDYSLTSGYYDCNCSLKSASAVGGVRITVTGPNVTVERRMDVQVSGDALQSIVDKWSGTFDQINGVLKLKRDCPGSAVSADWDTRFPAVDASSKKTVELTFPGELQTKTNGNVLVSPIYVFTKP